MSKKQPDIPLSELDGFEGISLIVAGRPLYHFSSVHSFHFGQREDDLGELWSDVELVLEELEPPRRERPSSGTRSPCMRLTGLPTRRDRLA